jgi:hypothetical protein
MVKFSKLLLIGSVFVFGCSSDNLDSKKESESLDSNKECTKIITIPGVTINTPSGISISPDWQMEVPCDYVIPPIEGPKEPKAIDKFSYEVLNFKFIPDTGKNTNRLQFEIKLNNLNDFAIRGYPMFTVNIDGQESSAPYSKGAISTCYQIDANSSCNFTFDAESTLQLGKINSIKLVTVKYYLLN